MNHSIYIQNAFHVLCTLIGLYGMGIFTTIDQARSLSHHSMLTHFLCEHKMGTSRR